MEKEYTYYEVWCYNCLPREFKVEKGTDINVVVQEHIKRQNKGVPKSEKTFLEKIIKL